MTTKNLGKRNAAIDRFYREDRNIAAAKKSTRLRVATKHIGRIVKEAEKKIHEYLDCMIRDEFLSVKARNPRLIKCMVWNQSTLIGMELGPGEKGKVRLTDGLVVHSGMSCYSELPRSMHKLVALLDLMGERFGTYYGPGSGPDPEAESNEEDGVDQ